MHSEVIDYPKLANLLERTTSAQQCNLDGMTLHYFTIDGRDVRVACGSSGTAVLFCSKLDASPVLNAISKPLPHLAIVPSSAGS